MTTMKVMPTVNGQQTGVEGGLVLRDSDGHLYFIRESLLDSLRIKGDGLTRMTRLLEQNPGSRDGDGLHVISQVHWDEIEEIAPQDPEEMGKFQLAALPPTTVMCPWFC